MAGEPAGDPAEGPDGDRRRALRGDVPRRVRGDAVFAFARAAEAHDPDTGSHLLRIRGLVECLAVELGMAEDEASHLGDEAMLHDVGKLLVPRGLLQHDGPLDEAEQALMRRHTTLGEVLLRGRSGLSRAAVIARSHHEAWDGSGYPDGLAGASIPAAARLVSAADILDALASPRAYKPGWDWDAAVAHVRELAGTALDPEVAAALASAEAAGRLREAWGRPRPAG